MERMPEVMEDMLEAAEDKWDIQIVVVDHDTDKDKMDSPEKDEDKEDIHKLPFYECISKAYSSRANQYHP